jgi:hypothetical protein
MGGPGSGRWRAKTDGQVHTSFNVPRQEYAEMLMHCARTGLRLPVFLRRAAVEKIERERITLPMEFPDHPEVRTVKREKAAV